MNVKIDEPQLDRIAELIAKPCRFDAADIIERPIGTIHDPDDADDSPNRKLTGVLRRLKREVDDMSYDMTAVEDERDELSNERDDLQARVEDLESRSDVDEILITRIVDAATSLRAVREGRGVIPLDHERLDTLPASLDQIAGILRAANS